MYSISQAFHDKYVKNVTPPTWKEHLKTSGSPSVATVTEKQKQGVLLLIRATQALYDTVGAHGYQRREGKIATFPF